MSAFIYYDGDCPVCANYVSFLKLKESVGPVSLVDLRDAPDEKAELMSQGFDLDKGMVFEMEGRRVAGGRCPPPNSAAYNPLHTF